jgi:hypothetical protein
LGVLYPYLDASLGSFTSITDTSVVGEIKAEELGTILLRAGSNGFFVIVANGNIVITERYSDFNPDRTLAAPNESITFQVTDGKAFSYLETYVPYYKGVRLAYSASPTTMQITLPQWFKGGRIDFESSTIEDCFSSEWLGLSRRTS